MFLRLISITLFLLLSGCLDNAKTSDGEASIKVIKPVANGGINQRFTLNTAVQLDGSGSYDSAQGSLSYQWSIKSKPSSSQASLTNASTPFASANLDIDGDYIFQLIVNNGQADSDPTTVTYSNQNLSPVADAGANQSARKNETVYLDGSRSHDMDGDSLTFTWQLSSQPAGSAAVLVDASTPYPSILVDISGEYKISLIVNDGNSDSKMVTVKITDRNIPPVVFAGQGITQDINSIVTLDSATSFDADGDALSYQWSIVSAPPASTVVLSDLRALNPTFTPDVAGDYLLQLIAGDGDSLSLPSVLHIHASEVAQPVITNTKPVARASGSGIIVINTTVLLNAGISFDANGDTLTYLWSILASPSGASSLLFNETTVTPSIAPDVAGDYIIQLIVNDGTVNSDPFSVTITANALPVVPAIQPIAYGGINQSFTVNGTVLLNGSRSYDPAKGSLSYLWSIQSKPSSSQASLSNASSPFASATLDVDGNYIFQLVVNNGQLSSEPVTVTYSNQNLSPVADAGANQSAHRNERVYLDGSRSHDMNGDTLTFAWILTSKPSGSTAALIDASTPYPSLLIDIPGEYDISLVVNDGNSDSQTATVKITDRNIAPVAFAGHGITQVVSTLITLDAAASIDADGDALHYQWSIISAPTGSTAALSDVTDLHPTFTPDVVGDYLLQLIADDGDSNSVPSILHIHANTASQPAVTNTKPIANANGSATVTVNTQVLLSGTASFDANGDTLTYLWSVLAEPTGATSTLTDETTEAPSITPDVAGDYVIQLIVNDGTANSDPVSVTITVNNPPVVAATAVPSGHQYFYSTDTGGQQGVGGFYSIDELALSNQTELSSFTGVAPILSQAGQSLVYNSLTKKFYGQIDDTGLNNGGVLISFDPETDTIDTIVNLAGGYVNGYHAYGYRLPVTFSDDNKWLFGSVLYGGIDGKGMVYIVNIDESSPAFGEANIVFELGSGAKSIDDNSKSRVLMPQISTKGIFFETNKVLFAAGQIGRASSQQDKDNIFYIQPTDNADWTKSWEAFSYRGISTISGSSIFREVDASLVITRQTSDGTAVETPSPSSRSGGDINFYCSNSLGVKPWGGNFSSNLYAVCINSGRGGSASAIMQASSNKPSIVRQFTNWGSRKAVGFSTSDSVANLYINNEEGLTSFYADARASGITPSFNASPSQIRSVEKANFADRLLFSGNDSRGYYFLGEPGISNNPLDATNDRFIATFSLDGGALREGAIVKYDRLDGSVTTTTMGFENGGYSYGKALHHSDGNIYGALKLTKAGKLSSGIYQYSPSSGTMTFGASLGRMTPAIKHQAADDGLLYGLGTSVVGFSTGHTQTLYSIDPQTLTTTTLGQFDSVEAIYSEYVLDISGDGIFFVSSNNIHCYNKTTQARNNTASFDAAGPRGPVRGLTYNSGDDSWYLPTINSTVANQGTIQKITNDCSTPVKSDAATGLTDIPSSKLLKSSTNLMVYGTTNGKLMTFNPTNSTIATLVDFSGDFAGASISVEGFLTEDSNNDLAGVLKVDTAGVISHHLFTVPVAGGAASYAALTGDLSPDTEYPGVIELN